MVNQTMAFYELYFVGFSLLSQHFELNLYYLLLNILFKSLLYMDGNSFTLGF